LHAVGGPQGKPLGCRTFPALYVDDGQAVRVTPAVECACVLASVGSAEDGELLVPEDVLTSDKLDEGIHIERLPDQIQITQKRYGARDDYVAWSRIVASAPPPSDIVGAFLALAEAVETWGLDPGAALRALSAPHTTDPAAMRPALFALAERARQRLNIDGSWRSPSDLALRSIRWILDAATLLSGEPAELARILATPPSSDEGTSEAFYLRAGAYGHHFVLGVAPLAHALRDRAVRLVLTRTIRTVVGPDEQQQEPVLRHPLALIEATLRGHGLLVRGTLL
jgi:lysine-N-methylase